MKDGGAFCSDLNSSDQPAWLSRPSPLPHTEDPVRAPSTFCL